MKRVRPSRDRARATLRAAQPRSNFAYRTLTFMTARQSPFTRSSAKTAVFAEKHASKKAGAKILAKKPASKKA